MPDEIRTSQPQPLPPTAEPWSIEQDADLLMNDLFANVDDLLEGTGQLPHHFVQQEPPGSIEPATVAAEDTTNTAITSLPSPKRTIRTYPQSKAAASQPMMLSTRLLAWQTRLMPHLDKVCFGIACLFMGGSILWVVNQNRLATSDVNPTGGELESVASLNIYPEDAQFIQYMLRSLQVINHQEPRAPISRVSQTNTGNTLVGETSTQTSPPVIERVYIPVYPPSTASVSPAPRPENRPTPASTKVPQVQVKRPQEQPSQAQPPQLPTLPTVPLPILPNVPRLNVPERSQPKRSTPEQAASERLQPVEAQSRQEDPDQSVVGRSPASLPRLDALPTFETPLPPQASASPPIPDQPPITTNPEPSPLPTEAHKLVGIVESGGRATAMFEVGEITQQVGLGEAISGSGWTLVSTDGQSATIRKNGEVRSIYLGQNF